MNIIKNLKFKMNDTIYIITGVWYSQGKEVAYEFKTFSWDEPVQSYYMDANIFKSKVKENNFLGL